MGLRDREYMRRPGSNGGTPPSGGSGLKFLMIAAIAVPLAFGAWKLYKSVSKEMMPGEGDLVVNVNTATQQELETIPGVGPVLARDIVRGRPYQSIEELDRVKGIGTYTLNSIRPYVKVEGETDRR